MLSQAILRGEGEEEEKRNGDMNFPLYFTFPVLLGGIKQKIYLKQFITVPNPPGISAIKCRERVNVPWLKHVTI